jgi:hypoxanthine phosphoribosyltransferase
METLKVQLRNGGECESNIWMAEDAFGYVNIEEREILKSRWDGSKRKNILIVDDINDSGATLNWIKNDWEDSCLPESDRWVKAWGDNIRIAVLVDNEASACKLNINYNAVDLNKAEEDSWIVFPWEDWWK